MVELSCGYKCIRILVGTFNLLAFFVGLIFVIVGGISLSSAGLEIKEVANVRPFAIIAIIFGCSILVLSFCGCCGAFKQVPCLLIVFSILMSLIFIILFATAAAALALKDRVTQAEIQKHFNDLFNQDKKFLDPVQALFECCGVNGISDYSTIGIPTSCCESSDPCTATSGDIFKKGCAEAVYNTLPKTLLALGVALLILLTILLLAIIMSSCLAAKIREGGELM